MAAGIVVIKILVSIFALHDCLCWPTCFLDPARGEQPFLYNRLSSLLLSCNYVLVSWKSQQTRRQSVQEEFMPTGRDDSSRITILLNQLTLNYIMNKFSVGVH